MPKQQPVTPPQQQPGRRSKGAARRWPLVGMVKSLLIQTFQKTTTSKAGSRSDKKIGSLLSQLRDAPQRSPEQWKQKRKSIRAAVRAHLEAQQPIPAIKKLTLALLEDPEFQPYHDLLCKAVELRHARRIKPGNFDPWASMPKDLRTEVVKLEAFAVYANQLEELLDEAGIPQPPAQSAPEEYRKKSKVEPQNYKTESVADETPIKPSLAPQSNQPSR